jgi:hypothetical protein
VGGARTTWTRVLACTLSSFHLLFLTSHDLASDWRQPTVTQSLPLPTSVQGIRTISRSCTCCISGGGLALELDLRERWHLGAPHLSTQRRSVLETSHRRLLRYRKACLPRRLYSTAARLRQPQYICHRIYQHFGYRRSTSDTAQFF